MLETQIHDLKEQIIKLPPGTLICSHNGKHYKWYQCIDHLKTYLSLLLEDLSHEKRALQFYLDHHSESPKTELLLKHPEYKALLSPNFRLLSEELSDWMDTPYERNPHHPEHLLHKSSSGNLVRSKSESIIDMLLYINKIPFRYECALQLDEITLFPVIPYWSTWAYVKKY